jgi:hypothetical protein
MAAGTFHRTEVPAGRAVTIVLARDRAGHYDRSIGPIDTPSHQVRRSVCVTGVAARAALSVLWLLGEPGSFSRCRRHPGGARAEASGAVVGSMTSDASAGCAT